MLAIRFIGGPLDGTDVPPEGGIPKPMPWAVYYPCGCVEFLDTVFTVGEHQGRRPEAYYPMDEERTTPSLVVYSLPTLTDDVDELPRALDAGDVILNPSPA